MKSSIRVATPPAVPLMVYDGDCKFCTLWIRRWRQTTGDRIDYLPFQDSRITTQFPEIPHEQFEQSVQLIMPDGSVYGGAEAVFRSLAENPDERWLLELYQRWPSIAGIADWSYRLVARHRSVFSFLTWLLWGRCVELPSHVFVRWTFLRSLGIIYLIAFLSLWVQIGGLIGANGILPARLTMESARQQANAAQMNIGRYHWLPTLCWISASDGFLKFQCAAGTALAVLVIAGIAPAPCLFLLWLIYLSLSSVAGVFLQFQWDSLLLETGFLAIFFAPLQWLPRRPTREAPPSRIALWLLRWLLFRLMFESGCVKWLSGDATWRNLTALNFHYETQPLPTWIGWYAHQLPTWVHKSDTVMMFVIEIGLPFLIFLTRRPRQLAALAFLALQFFILLTGNYCFFNLLTMVLCVSLLDDAALRKCVPERCFSLARKFVERCRQGRSADRGSAVSQAAGVLTSQTPDVCGVGRLAVGDTADRRSALRRWPAVITVPLLVLVLGVSLVQLIEMFAVRDRAPLPRWHPVMAVQQWLYPFRSINSYGLFRVMTTSRPEIIIEGSNDGVTWQEYAFRYKAGDLKRAPRFVEPHQPRLDWQMWFTALGDRNPWFVNFCVRLLQGSPEVIGLLERNPFPNAPPRYLRGLLYEYHFTDSKTRRRTGEWWRRELKGIILPPISLQQSP